jgi:hypothetical protein
MQCQPRGNTVPYHTIPCRIQTPEEKNASYPRSHPKNIDSPKQTSVQVQNINAQHTQSIAQSSAHSSSTLRRR